MAFDEHRHCLCHKQSEVKTSRHTETVVTQRSRKEKSSRRRN